MEQTTKDALELLGATLRHVQTVGIGIARVYDEDLVVVEEDNGCITTVSVDHLLGWSQMIRSIESVRIYKRFPDGKTLTDMLQDPVSFVDWRDKYFPRKNR